jgi:Family of unknown function (DUF6370)
MKKTSMLFAGLAGLLMLLLATPIFAAEKGKSAKVRTIVGEAKCAKCALHKSDKCQTVIQAKTKSGKTITYYLAANDVSKAFHKNVCQEARKVTATGTVKMVHGKHELIAKKIELGK